MDGREQEIIDGLFGKLQTVEGKSGPRDEAAQAHINAYLSRQPNAPYYMAQALIAQEHALNNLQARIQKLEQENAQRPASGGGGFLSGLFGGGDASGKPQAPVAPPPSYQPSAGSGPWGRQPGYGQSQGRFGGGFGGGYGRGVGGGGFLAGAAQTAMGVAGGMLVVNALESAFSSGDAAAAAPEETGSGFADQPTAVDEGAADQNLTGGDQGAEDPGQDFTDQAPGGQDNGDQAFGDGDVGGDGFGGDEL